MRIQRLSKTRSEEGRREARVDERATPVRRAVAPRPLLLALLLVTLQMSGCSGLPSRPRLPHLPIFQGARDAAEPVRNLRLLLPNEGPLTEALSRQAAGWAADRELQVDIFTTAEYAQELHERLQVEEPPDLFVVSSFLFPDLVADGLLAPAADGFFEPQGYPPHLAAAFVWPPEGESAARYCLPREVRTLALIYDSDGLASSAHQSPPSDWESLRAVAVEQTDLDSNRFGFIESPDLSRWLPFLYGAGGTILDESGRMTLHSPAAASALDWYIQIFRDNVAGHAGESNNEWAGQVLGKGKGALTIEGNWVVPYFDAEFPTFRYGIAPLPAGPAQLNVSVAFTSCLAVYAHSQFVEEAFDLAAFLTGAAQIRALPNDGGWMPAQTALRDEWRQEFPHLVAFADAVPQSRVWQFSPGFGPFLRSFNRGMAQLFTAEVEAADFLEELQQLGEQILAAASDQ